MMNNDLVSIIVPVYNVEKYIEKCLNSLFGQTYRELDIILVDDGSTDKSGELCDRLAKMDKRVRVIHKKKRRAVRCPEPGNRCCQRQIHYFY